MQAKSLSLYFNETLWRSVAAIAAFAALTALTARITIHLPFTPVPITLQVLAVVLAGLVLGARSGALSQLAYLGMLAAGLPFDANALGAAAFFGPTAGYLVGFVLTAFVAGWLAERFAVHTWWGNFAAALAGLVALYVAGATWLAVLLGSWETAWVAGVAPFILIDVVKAAIAAGVAESGKLLLRR